MSEKKDIRSVVMETVKKEVSPAMWSVQGNRKPEDVPLQEFGAIGNDSLEFTLLISQIQDALEAAGIKLELAQLYARPDINISGSMTTNDLIENIERLRTPSPTATDVATRVRGAIRS